MIELADVIAGACVAGLAFLIIFALAGVGSPYNKWDSDGDKAVLDALENGKREA